MTSSAGTATSGADIDGFTPLRVKAVVPETDDAVSIVFDEPAEHADRLRYLPGQYLTLRVTVDGREHQRCYSMSSAPALGQDLRVTVKRDRDGIVSNWLNDHAAAGDWMDVGAPQGRFTSSGTARPLVAFAGGSGITPVFSLIQTALAAQGGARLLYANRAAGSIIFEKDLAALTARHAGRFVLHHHIDDEHGLITAERLERFLADLDDITGAEYFICGPGPFMDTVQAALTAAGVPTSQMRLERFTVAAPVADEPCRTETVTIELGRDEVTVGYRAGHTLLQTARMAGLKAPSSCETGSCGTCIAQVTEGGARLLNNDALDDDEIADGWVVTCQAIPTSPTVRVVYE